MSFGVGQGGMLHTAPAWSRALNGDRVGSTIDDGRGDERQHTAPSPLGMAGFAVRRAQAVSSGHPRVFANSSALRECREAQRAFDQAKAALGPADASLLKSISADF